MNRAQRLRSLEAERSYDGDLMRSYIAGATVIRRLEIGGTVYPRGSMLSRPQVLDIGRRNLRAMVINHFLEIKLGPPTH